MQTKTYNLYNYNELSDEAQGKARQWYIDNNDYPFLSEFMNECAESLLEASGIKADDVKVFYSLSYAQGDGAMIEMSGKWGEYNFTVKQSGHYYHYNSKTIELWDESGEISIDADEKEYKDFNDIYVSVCQELEKAGYAEIEYQDSDEVVADTITANEYTFLADGTRHD